MVGPPGWVPGGGGGQGRHFPHSGILPELFDGRGHPAEAQGCYMMGDSHDCDTLGLEGHARWSDEHATQRDTAQRRIVRVADRSQTQGATLGPTGEHSELHLLVQGFENKGEEWAVVATAGADNGAQ